MRAIAAAACFAAVSVLAPLSLRSDEGPLNSIQRQALPKGGADWSRPEIINVLTLRFKEDYIACTGKDETMPQLTEAQKADLEQTAELEFEKIEPFYSCWYYLRLRQKDRIDTSQGQVRHYRSGHTQAEAEEIKARLSRNSHVRDVYVSGFGIAQ